MKGIRIVSLSLISGERTVTDINSSPSFDYLSGDKDGDGVMFILTNKTF